MKKTTKKQNERVKIIPLGGLDKIGMNITAIEYNDTILVIDCGISFPDDEIANRRFSQMLCKDSQIQ